MPLVALALRCALAGAAALLLAACGEAGQTPQAGPSIVVPPTNAATRAAAAAMPTPLAAVIAERQFVPIAVRVTGRPDGDVTALTYRTATADLQVRRQPCPAGACGTFPDRMQPLLASLWPPGVPPPDIVHLAFPRLELRFSGPNGPVHLHGFEVPGEVQVWRVDGLPDADHVALRDRLATGIEAAAADRAATLDAGLTARFARPLAAQAARLESAGQTTPALALYRRLVAARPADYAAQARIAELSSDEAEARAAARIVYDGAEDPQQQEIAARRLGIALPHMDDVLAIERWPTGLVVKLMVDPPVDLRLVQQAAEVYQRMTGIPVHVRRWQQPLDFPWVGGPRPRYARDVQRELRGATVPSAAFAGWDLARYQQALRERADEPGRSPSDRFRLRDWANRLGDLPPEYDVTPMLEAYGRSIMGVRSHDRRVMYVLVTARPIYGEDFLYVFNRSMDPPYLSPVAVMSYAELMDLAAPDRPRLIERFAKEMVPATLKQLGISRPTDPTDPHSQAGGLEDTDRKTLTLSAPTRAALQRYMDAQ